MKFERRQIWTALLLVLPCASSVGNPISDPLCPWGRPLSGDSSLLLLKYSAFECGYAPRIRLSRWVAYRYFRTRFSNIPRKRFPFVPDTFRLNRTQSGFSECYESVPVQIRTTVDRGHLAPDAAIKAFGTDAQRETYFLTNITPQFANVNRYIWRYLEGKIRQWAGAKDTVWVVVGPVFYSRTDTAWLGTRSIPIPHAHYCVVARKRRPEVISFLVTNDSCRRYGRDLLSCLVSVDSVEGLTGLNLFPALSPTEEHRVEARPLRKLWR